MSGVPGMPPPDRLHTSSIATGQAVTEWIHDPIRMARICETLAGEGAPATLVGRRAADGTAPSWPVASLSLDAPGALRVHLDSPCPFPAVALRAVGPYSTYRVFWAEASAVPEGLRILASRVERHRERTERRVRLPGAVCEIDGVQRPVTDASFSGLAFDGPTPNAERCEGAVIVKGARVPFSGLIRPGAARTGVTLTQTPAQTWRALIAQHDPNVAAARPATVDDVWPLYQASGYFKMTHEAPESFEPLRAAHGAVVAAYREHPEIGCQTLIRDARGPIATVGLARLNHRAWFGQHMAKRHDRSTPVHLLRDIHWQILDHLLAFPESEWLVGLIQAYARFPYLAHISFAERFAGTPLAEVVSVDVWRMGCDSLHPPCDVRPVGPGDAEVFARLGQVRSPIYRAALDLTPESIGFQRIGAMYDAAGLVRARQAWVTPDSGPPRGLLVAEHASAGVHLYDMLDVARYYPLVDDAPDWDLVPLLDAARGWYARRGCTDFIFHQESEVSPQILGRAEHLAAAMLSLVHRDAIPDLAEHLWEIVGRARSR